ncbi:MAG: hypothetical protein RL213_470 [Bacteroidota bacterium]|jgi:uncharacterized membrane protein
MKSDKHSKDELKAMHEDSSRWRWGIFYSNPEDPRIWVPKKTPVMGYTLNFAHRGAWWWLIGLMSLPIGSLAVAFIGSLCSGK